MINLRTIVLGACVLTVSGCGNFNKHSEVDALKQVQPVGSAFTQQLADEYREFVSHALHNQADRPDGIHFARKGLAAASGKRVLPEPVSDWNLLPQQITELSSARNRLLAVYDIGARELAPEQSAVAQARFDCWIEFEEEHDDRESSYCASEFMTALTALESAIRPPPMPEPEIVMPEPEIIEPMTPEEAMYLVFFDFDASDVGPGGSSVLDAVAEEAKSRNINAINIVGHTDSAGPETYNSRLAVKRGNNVRNGLIARGIDAAVIQVEGRGENELLVTTPDNIREPANRRAQITFE